MPKIKVPTDLSNIDDDNQFRRFCSIAINAIVDLINGGLLPRDNFKTDLVTCAFTAFDTTIGFNHNLSKVPDGYIIYGLTDAMVIYNGTIDNSDTKIYLRSSVVGTARVLVF